MMGPTSRNEGVWGFRPASVDGEGDDFNPLKFVRQNILFVSGTLWLITNQSIRHIEAVLLHSPFRLMFPILCWISYSTKTTYNMLTQTFTL